MKNLLGNKQQRAVDSITNCENASSEVTQFSTKRSNFPWIWFWDLRMRFWCLEIKHPKAHVFVWQGWVFFSSIIISLQLSPNFTGLLFYEYWDAPSEKTGLWQLPKVSSVFNYNAVTITTSHCRNNETVDSFPMGDLFSGGELATVSEKVCW